MKAISAYVNGLNLPSILRQLQIFGAKEMNVIEYYSVSPKISRLSFVCEDPAVENACSVLCGLGVTRTFCDCMLRVSDDDPMTKGGVSSLQTAHEERFVWEGKEESRVQTTT